MPRFYYMKIFFCYKLQLSVYFTLSLWRAHLCFCCRKRFLYKLLQRLTYITSQHFMYRRIFNVVLNYCIYCEYCNEYWCNVLLWNYNHELSRDEPKFWYLTRHTVEEFNQVLTKIKKPRSNRGRKNTLDDRNKLC